MSRPVIQETFGGPEVVEVRDVAEPHAGLGEVLALRRKPSTARCCDSPYEPAGDPDISASWPGGIYGGGPAPMIVISRQGPRHATDATPSNHYSMLLTTVPRTAPARSAGSYGSKHSLLTGRK